MAIPQFLYGSDYVRVGRNLYVIGKQNTDFIERVKKDLAVIATHEVGKRLLTRIAEGRHVVSISYAPDTWRARAQDRESSFLRDVGSATEIIYPATDKEAIGFDRPIPGPSFIRFAHELIHAYHNSYGKNCRRGHTCGDQGIWLNDEEVHTIVGFPSKKGERSRPKITENAIREEHGLPIRFSHFKKDQVSPMFKITSVAQKVVNAVFCGTTLFRAGGYNNPPPIANLSHPLL